MQRESKRGIVKRRKWRAKRREREWIMKVKGKTKRNREEQKR